MSDIKPETTRLCSFGFGGFRCELPEGHKGNHSGSFNAPIQGEVAPASASPNIAESNDRADGEA